MVGRFFEVPGTWAPWKIIDFLKSILNGMSPNLSVGLTIFTTQRGLLTPHPSPFDPPVIIVLPVNLTLIACCP